MLRPPHWYANGLWRSSLEFLSFVATFGDAADNSVAISPAAPFSIARKFASVAKEIPSGLHNFSNCFLYLVLLLMIYSE
jgi:hypothetical protein